MVLATAPACASSWEAVAHTPGAVDGDPYERLRYLMMSGKGTRPVRVDVESSYAAVIFVVSGATMTQTLSFDAIAKVEIETMPRRNGWVVSVYDSAGEYIWGYAAVDEAAAREFVDVLAAIRN